MVTEKLAQKRMQLAGIEAKLFRASEQRLGLLNQIQILEELVKEKEVPNDEDEVKVK